jgi:hypothetical protein
VVEQLLAPPTMLTGGLGRGRVPAYHCTAIFSANEGFEALLEVRVLITSSHPNFDVDCECLCEAFCRRLYVGINTH